MDRGDLGDDGLGEGPPVPQRAAGTEGEHRQVEVARNADQEIELRLPALGPDPLERRASVL
ncbi:MAG: hypothetical protein ACR2KN_07895, partial [Geodermatophilaceae bacterium]